MIQLTLHPRLCDICENIAETPYAALWDCHINERVTCCSRMCFDHYKNAMMRRYIKPLCEIKTSERRGSI